MSMFDIRKVDGTHHTSEEFKLRETDHPRCSDPLITGAVPQDTELRASRPLPNFSLLKFNPATDPINPFEGAAPAQTVDELKQRLEVIMRRGAAKRRYMNNQIASEFSRRAMDSMDRILKETFK